MGWSVGGRDTFGGEEFYELRTVGEERVGWDLEVVAVLGSSSCMDILFQVLDIVVGCVMYVEWSMW